MTNDRIQAILAKIARNKLQPTTIAHVMVTEADEVIRFMAGPDGALQIADAAACELICSECRCFELDGVTWWEIEPAPKQAELVPDDEEADIARQVSTAMRYLTARGLVGHHPSHVGLIRPLLDGLQGGA